LRYQEILEACWKGYRQVGMKDKGGRQVPNCVPVSEQEMEEDLKKWFKEKWVRFGPDGKIRGDCARGSSSEGKPKCLPQAKAQALGKKGRASSAAKKRREDPDPERRGAAKNVATRVKEGLYDSNPATYDLPRRQLNVPELIKRGAIFITEPHGPNGWEPDAEGFSLVTLYNVAKGGWPAEAKQHLKPSMYRAAESGLNRQGPGSMLYDGKYRQILWSIKKLGIPNEVAFLDKQEQLEEKQDACYHKVKSRYKVWPSAYASGALVQCRKKGAANWGNKDKK
jgi:hypothetical protein